VINPAVHLIKTPTDCRLQKAEQSVVLSTWIVALFLAFTFDDVLNGTLNPHTSPRLGVRRVA
jgi:hypothetical protein